MTRPERLALPGLVVILALLLWEGVGKFVWEWVVDVVPPAGQTESRREAMLAVEDRYSGRMV